MREDRRGERVDMPPRSKVQDHEEAKRWLQEGKSYQWMVQKYLDKYNIQTTPSYWAVYASRNDLPLRISRDTELIPWKVAKQHRWDYNLVMLRFEARRRAGEELKADEASRLESWKRWLDEEGLVIYYDPDTEDGFFAVPRETQDKDLVRMPSNPSHLRAKTTRAKNAN
ncbi:hypothetical protein ABZ705_04660 [Streptomyces sp. NPDC006984]|uniref:hypothetical protein n=1 Tax=Streptomyces sp. NPDC006984 TaxID=3155463 RepID=UPI003410AE6E